MTAVERRRSPLRQSPIGAVALPGLCTEPGCSDVWLIETDHGRLCRAHHSAARAVLVASSAPATSTGVAGGASRSAQTMTAATQPPGGRSPVMGESRPSR